jgi:hypothetical protein
MRPEDLKKKSDEAPASNEPKAVPSIR